MSEANGDNLQRLVRQVSEDNRILRLAGQRSDMVMRECLEMLDAAGMGKGRYGNTLLGMTKEACERLANKALSEGGEKVGEAMCVPGRTAAMMEAVAPEGKEG